MCDGKALRIVLAEEVSNDGIVWTRTGKYKPGDVIEENNDSKCGSNSEGKYGKWMEVDGYICDGTTKFKKMAFFTSDTFDGAYTRTSIEKNGDVLEFKSKDCGWFDGIDKYEIRWVKVGEECIGTTKYAKFIAKYFKEDGTEYTPPTNQYLYEVIEENCEACGYVDEFYKWVLTDTVKCFECNG